MTTDAESHVQTQVLTRTGTSTGFHGWGLDVSQQSVYQVLIKCLVPNPLENDGVWCELFYNSLIISMLQIQCRPTPIGAGPEGPVPDFLAGGMRWSGKTCVYLQDNKKRQHERPETAYHPSGKGIPLPGDAGGSDVAGAGHHEQHRAHHRRWEGASMGLGA